MDDRRFDGMSRAFAAAASRRGALKGAVALALGAGALAVGDAAARPALCRPAGRYCTHNRQCCNSKCRTGKRVPIASRNICDCDAPFGMCGKMCRDLSSDPNHCGTCGNRVSEDERCCDGVPTPIDADNCAACGDVCGPDDLCCADTGGCIDRLSDPNNCGGCGVVCDGGECIDGECPAACDYGLADGKACTVGVECCSLNCSDGVCNQPTVDCATYTTQDAGLSGCYRLIGNSHGAVIKVTDLPCGPVDVQYNGDSCASSAECQAYVTQSGLVDVVAFCVDQITACSGGKCVPGLAPGQTLCGFWYTVDAICPP